MSSPRIRLNMIVKNEVANIPRALDSVIEHIDSAVIFDTGSTDGTIEYIKGFFEAYKIPHIVPLGSFKNFEQARNAALTSARVWRPNDFDYLLLMDADMELKVDGPLSPLTAESYCLIQRAGNLSYHNVRLLARWSTALYHGVTHEYLGANEQKRLLHEEWWFQDHATGSNRGDKAERDIRLLEGYLADHPEDGRTLFYLAQTYKDLGQHAKAIGLYRRRIAAAGWDEEVWFSRLALARCYRDMGDKDQFVLHALQAFSSRPTRAEPLYDLAKHYREQPDQQATAWLFADAGSKIPYPEDMLFVEKDIYDHGFLSEKAVLGFYGNKTKVIGASAANKLSLMASTPSGVRDLARSNLYWYLEPLSELAPSFKAVRLPDVNPDTKFVNTNPSIASDGSLKTIIRTVSYRIREDGSYDYNGLPAIRTTSFLADVSPDFTLGKVIELKRPVDFPPPVFHGVLDIEDLRLYPYQGRLHATGCVLEQNPDAWREQFFFEINPDNGQLWGWERIEPKTPQKQNQKNWMPIVDHQHPLRWMYKPGEIIYLDGSIVGGAPLGMAVDQLAGGSQLIPFEGGHIGLVHEAQPDPTTGKRYYRHRFVYYDDRFVLTRVSKPFVFFAPQIEFAAGLARCYETGKFVISFGVQDREAWLASIAAHDVRELIWRL